MITAWEYFVKNYNDDIDHRDKDVNHLFVMNVDHICDQFCNIVKKCEYIQSCDVPEEIVRMICHPFDW